MKSVVRSKWSHAVMVCRKCSKKLDGGFGPAGKDRLAKYLRRSLSATKGRKSRIGIIEVPCLDVCPKKAVVVIDSRRPQQWQIIGTDDDVAQLATSLASDTDG